MKTFDMWKKLRLLCAAKGTAGHQLGLEACAVCGRSGIVFKNDEAVLQLSAVNLLRKLCLRFSFDLCICVGLALKTSKSGLEMDTKHGQTLRT